MTETDLELSGISIAGIETCIEVPPLGLLLDIGRCPPFAVDRSLVLVSHGHLDHIGAITQHAARRAMMKRGESTYLVPRAVAPLVEALFNAAGALDGQQIPHRVIPLGPGDVFELGKKRWVRPFETYHPVPSQGYTVWERRHRLRPEFAHKTGPELGRLRRQGVELDEAYDAPLLSFTGDTRVDVLEQNPELTQTESLVIESSFLDQRVSTADAQRMGHIHLEELIEREALLPAGEIVLCHFSARYTEQEIADLVERKLPDSLQGRVRRLSNVAK